MSAWKFTEKYPFLHATINREGEVTKAHVVIADIDWTPTRSYDFHTPTYRHASATYCEDPTSKFYDFDTIDEALRFIRNWWAKQCLQAILEQFDLHKQNHSYHPSPVLEVEPNSLEEQPEPLYILPIALEQEYFRVFAPENTLPKLKGHIWLNLALRRIIPGIGQPHEVFNFISNWTKYRFNIASILSPTELNQLISYMDKAGFPYSRD